MPQKEENNKLNRLQRVVKVTNDKIVCVFTYIEKLNSLIHLIDISLNSNPIAQANETELEISESSDELTTDDEMPLLSKEFSVW